MKVFPGFIFSWHHVHALFGLIEHDVELEVKFTDLDLVMGVFFCLGRGLFII